jgi:peroxiredoxin
VAWSVFTKKVKKMKKIILAASFCASMLFAQEVKSDVPTFSFPDVSGKIHTQSEYVGKPLLIDFWATWCVSCIHTIPFVKKMNEQYGPQGLNVVGISIDKKNDKFSKFIEKNAMNYPILWDKENSLSKVLNFEAVPSLFLFDAQGQLVLAIKGYDEKGEEQILKAIQTLFPNAAK